MFENLAVNSPLAQLDHAIANYAAEFAKSTGWIETGCAHDSRYASREYRCGDLLLRATNDRGLIDLEIAHVARPNAHITVSELRTRIDPPRHGRWNLGLGGSIEFLAARWKQLPDEVLRVRHA